MYKKLTFDEDIELGQLIESVVNFEVVKDWVYTPAYATKKSIRQTEFYQAANVGLKPEMVFMLREFEFDNHERLIYKEKTYEIIRVYVDDGIAELTVTAMTGSEI